MMAKCPGRKARAFLLAVDLLVASGGEVPVSGGGRELVQALALMAAGLVPWSGEGEGEKNTAPVQGPYAV